MAGGGEGTVAAFLPVVVVLTLVTGAGAAAGAAMVKTVVAGSAATATVTGREDAVAPLRTRHALLLYHRREHQRHG